ncbi:MAG: hypothetical protein FWG37_04565, partial [Clostridia bacterium]|nr:hypothetical protein [Clostridia bacterium]
VQLKGVHGIGDESGSPGLIVRGDGTRVILSGNTLVEGGRSGPMGERGGDGVLLEGHGADILLHDRAYAAGGTGNFYGGHGVRMLGCDDSLLIGGSAASMGKGGLAEGGAGVYAPGCAKIIALDQGTAGGGASPYTAGGGIRSIPCDSCKALGTSTVKGEAIVTGGVGAEGGNAIWVTRVKRGNEPDILLDGTPMLIGGSGGAAGSAIRAENCVLLYSGTPMLFAGNYYETESPVKQLSKCRETGDSKALVEERGVQVSSYPANNVTSVIRAELESVNERAMPKTIENGLTTGELFTKLDGKIVDKGRVTQMTLGGKTLLISMYDATLEARLQYTPRLSTDGGDGLRLILIASKSEEALSVEATVAALRKLRSEGFTQFAYTSVEPVYCERMIDIDALLEAIEEEEEEPKTVLFGTADDMVMYPRGKGNREYKIGLMERIRIDMDPWTDGE